MSRGGQEYHAVPDEGYWTALLNEGENARSVYPEIDTESDEFDEDDNHEFIPETSEQIDNDWQEIERIADHDGALSLKVVGYNRGGLLVEWRTLRGFVPASQLLDFPANGGGQSRRAALVERVGHKLQLRVIELDAEKNRLILSERAAQVESGRRHEILHELRPGDTVEGEVTNLCDFGAFVDLGGIEGLIHISELSWGRVAHPSDLLQSGQQIKAYVLDVDRGTSRIAMSLKRLYPDPWKTVQERYQVGQLVEGTITHVVDFGAFACIEQGLEGLIHISELAEGHFLHPRNVVSEGESVRARILSIDGKARRLGLSLRLV
jgi:small subunit ribosomal protein S1